MAGVAALATTLSASGAMAALVHQYTFNDGTANDSVGGAHGTIVDPGGISGFLGGAIDFRTNDAFASNQDFTQPTAQGAYVDLPNDILSTAAGTPTSLGGGPNGGQVTLEMWYTEQTHRNWARLFDFGTSNNGEDTSDSGDASEYIFVTSAQGTNGLFVAETHSTASGGVQFPTTPDYPGSPDETVPALTVGVPHHIALVLDQSTSSGDVGDNGTATLYHNGVSVGSAPIVDTLFLDLMANNNNWLGRSQWGDQLFDGVYDEFRIYDNALSAGDVLSSYT
ncbi:MAG: LamG domain-containing protein, partial [Planctomycetales bacterium]|nr:LamG domain-containing protein [Planctomycetales bacterium]